jgi:hypothetical protein
MNEESLRREMVEKESLFTGKARDWVILAIWR